MVGVMILGAGCAAVPVVEAPLSSAAAPTLTGMSAAEIEAAIERLEKQIGPLPSFWPGFYLCDGGARGIRPI